MTYWLVKSEPFKYSWEQLEKDKQTYWDGVRNYQARNFLRDTIKVGDLVLFYHSSCDPAGIAGIAEVVKSGYPDHTAFDKKHAHFDPDSDEKNPTWYMVEIKHVKTFPKLITLDKLKKVKGLEKMVLLQKGSRLSIQPVSELEWSTILKLC